MLKNFFILLFLFFPSLTIHAEQQLPFVAEVTADNINLRAGQSTNFENLGRLPKGEQVVVVDKSYSWYKIKLPLSAKSYVSASLIQMVRDDVGEIFGNRVNVRAQPKADATSLGQLNKGTLVRVIGNLDSGWFRIEPPEQSYGWVLAEYLTFRSQDVPPTRIVELPTRNIYRKRRIAQEKAAAEAAQAPQVQSSTAVAQGIVEDLGQQTFSPDVRHKIQVDEKTIYCLKGYRSIIDGFLHNRVKIEGTVESSASSPYPVILVTKINLVL